MKKLMRWLIALAAFSGSALLAQSLVGTWQGALKIPQAPNGELRDVIKISTTDADSLKAVMYSIDQSGQGVNATSVTLQGSSVKMSIVGIGGTYEGRLSADGNSIAGTWTQGSISLPLNLARATPETAWTIPEPPPPPKIMAPDANPAFEVATIKPSRPEERYSLLVRGGIFTTTATSVSDLLKFAYDLHPKQIKGPSWLETEKYDVTGKPDQEGVPSINQLKVMIQKLLADRFQLTFHREKKELSVYAITIAKGGAKIAKDDNNPNGLPGFGGSGRGNLGVRNATMTEFAQTLQGNILDQPVVDQTGLGSGRYDFTLKWTPDASQLGFGGGAGPPPPPPADNPDAPPDLFTAFQQQLGLKLESTKAPVDELVIDRAEKPSAN